MGVVYFVRHGESEWNVADKICGQTDVMLTSKGYEQARESGRLFIEKAIKADEIICSPLIRAAETAKTISETTGIPMRVEPRLIEQNFGVWEGHSPRRDPVFQTAKTQFVTSYGGGESMLRLAQRIYNLLDEIVAGDKTYIMVAHNGIARVVASYFMDMTNEEYSRYCVGNCSITEFNY